MASYLATHSRWFPGALEAALISKITLRFSTMPGDERGCVSRVRTSVQLELDGCIVAEGCEHASPGERSL